MRPRDLGLEAELTPMGQGWRVFLYDPAGAFNPRKVARVLLGIAFPDQREVETYCDVGLDSPKLLAAAEGAVQGFLDARQMALDRGFIFDGDQD